MADRHRATRQVCRALSERRVIALWTGFVVSSQIAWFAFLAGSRALTWIVGGVAVALLYAVCEHAEPEPERGPKGPIAKLPEDEFERLVQKVDLEGELLAAGVMVTADSPDPSGDGSRASSLMRSTTYPSSCASSLSATSP